MVLKTYNHFEEAYAEIYCRGSCRLPKRRPCFAWTTLCPRHPADNCRAYAIASTEIELPTYICFITFLL